MTHVPQNPWCPSCQRAKPQRKPCKRNAHVGPVPTAFGEQVTADHIITMDDEARGMKTSDMLWLFVIGQQSGPNASQ